MSQNNKTASMLVSQTVLGSMNSFLKPMQMDTTLLANNSQHCCMLRVASICTPCCMLLCIVRSCCAKFETSQTYEPTTPNISFVPWSPKSCAIMLDLCAQVFRHCWGHTRALHMVSKVLWVVSLPHHCQHVRNNFQHCSLLAQQNWELLRLFAHSFT